MKHATFNVICQWHLLNKLFSAQRYLTCFIQGCPPATQHLAPAPIPLPSINIDRHIIQQKHQVDDDDR